MEKYNRDFNYLLFVFYECARDDATKRGVIMSVCGKGLIKISKCTMKVTWQDIPSDFHEWSPKNPQNGVVREGKRRLKKVIIVN